jgi:hypothetical protein
MNFFGHSVKRRRPRSERGQGSLESLGIFVLAAILATSTVGVIAQSSPAFRENVSYQFCKIVKLGGGGGECTPPSEPRQAEAYVPPEQCVVGANGEDDQGSLMIAVVKMEDGETWLIEDLGNGKSRLTRSTNEGVGLTTGIGFEVTGTVDGHKMGLALGARATALLAGTQGDVYYADNPDQAKAILNGKETDDTKDFWWGDGGPVRWVADKVGGKNKYEDTEPDETWSEGGFKADGVATGTLLWGSAEAKVAEEAYLGTKTKKDGSTTSYFRGKMSGEAGVDIGVSDAEVEGSLESLVEVDRDKDGNPVAMRLISAVMGNAAANDNLDDEETKPPQYTKKTIQIPLETPAQKDLASRVLWATGLPFMPGVSDGITSTDAVGAPWQINQIGKDLAAEVNQDGFMWEEDYTQESSTNGYDVDVEVGLVLGGSGKWSKTAQELKSYKYWDGTQWASREGCGE